MTISLDRNILTGLQRENGILTFIEDIADWISPRLGIRFLMTEETLKVFYPDGQPFLTTIKFHEKATQAKLQAERNQLEVDRLRQLLRDSGINIPDDKPII